MDCTVRLGLDFIVAGQAQKEVSHNEALRDLDALCQLVFVGRGDNAPPAVPVEGGAYAVGSSPSGDWSGQGGKIAIYQGGWKFKVPLVGWVAYSIPEGRLFVFDGSLWRACAWPSVETLFAWTPGTIANGAGVTSSSVAVTGAKVGDFVLVAAPYSLQGVLVSGFVSAENVVLVRLQNMTGASVSLGAGNWKVRVMAA